MLGLEEARERIKINKHDLDTELIQQSVLFDEIAERAVMSASTRDEMKRKTDETYAKRARYFRDTAKEKITEGRIAELTELDPAYMKAKDAFEEAKLEASLWSVKKETYLQRGLMLRELCGLYTAGYFSTTSVQSSTPAQELSRQTARSKLREVKLRRKERDE